MNSIANLFSSSLIQSIGWTLLHSLWQAALVLLVVTVINRSIRNSAVRYGISLCGLTGIFLFSISTFLYLQHTATATTATPLTSASDFNWPSSMGVQTSLSSPAITNTIQSAMDIIVGCWIIGVILFSLRVIGGSIYVSTLRRNSVMLHGGWRSRVQEMAHQLSINRIIALAESPLVHAPVLLGYIKPIIILPTGMLSGLSAEQIEMILTHELMHIKRHDYLVNIFQMVLEAVFFFNPFVWKLSEDIRKEREHCCDDAVVSYHHNARVYAAALAQLEEVRLSRMGIAMGLAQNKNQLLNRIKRLMENSVKNYSAQGRIIPAVLLVTGLLCASWLTISKGAGELERDLADNNHTLAAQDTSIHPQDKNVGYSRTEITTIDKNGEPHTEIIENYDVDADGDLFVDHDFEIPEPPAIPDFDMAFPPVPDFIFEFDTVPGKGSYFSIADFEKFSEQFQKEFKEQFGCVTKNSEIQAKVMADMAQQEALIQHQLHSEMMASNLEEHALAMAEHTKAMEKMNEDLKHWEKEHTEQLKAIEKNMKRIEENMKEFDAELQKELIKDGYLKAGDKIKNIHWNTKGDIEVNEKKIRDEHKNKYNKLHDRFFDEKDLISAE